MAEGLSTNKLIIAGFICLLCYVLLFAFNAARGQIGNFPDFFPIFTLPSILESPMFFAMPFFGFFALFLLVDWVNKAFDTGLGLNPIFLAIFFFLALAAYYVALYWYFANFAAMQNIPMTPEQVDFWGKLHSSAFMLFLWAGVFGWVARYAVEKINL